MSNAVVAKLKAAIGQDHVLEQKSEMAKYLKGTGNPLAVVLPGNTADVAAVVKLANEYSVKINVAGQVVDTKGLDEGIAMVMVRMNQVLEIDHENLTAHVEPGMLHKDFLAKVVEEGLYFPPEPFNNETGSLGGCFAIGEADSKSFNFGPSRTYILGWEMVTPTGEVLKVGNKCIKNVSGYDLIHLMVGSQGTLGIFTKLLVKLLPKPEAKRAVLANFASLQDASKVLTSLTLQGTFPTRLILLNWSLAQTVVARNPELPFNSGYLALVDLEGFNKSTVKLSEQIAAAFKLAGASEVVIVADCEQYEGVMNSWLEVKTKLNTAENNGIDFSVGPANLVQALSGLESIAGDLASVPGLVAYVSSGNIRVQLPESAQKEALGKINALALSLGGNISGALGLKLRAQDANSFDLYEELANLVSSVRKEFDPKGIMAPGIGL